MAGVLCQRYTCFLYRVYNTFISWEMFPNSFKFICGTTVHIYVLPIHLESERLWQKRTKKSSWQLPIRLSKLIVPNFYTYVCIIALLFFCPAEKKPRVHWKSNSFRRHKKNEQTLFNLGISISPTEFDLRRFLSEWMLFVLFFDENTNGSILCRYFRRLVYFSIETWIYLDSLNATIKPIQHCVALNEIQIQNK